MAIEPPRPRKRPVPYTTSVKRLPFLLWSAYNCACNGNHLDMTLPQTSDQALAFILGNHPPVVGNGSARWTRLWGEVLIFYILNILNDVSTSCLRRAPLQYPCHGVVAGKKKLPNRKYFHALRRSRLITSFEWPIRKG